MNVLIFRGWGKTGWVYEYACICQRRKYARKIPIFCGALPVGMIHDDRFVAKVKVNSNYMSPILSQRSMVLMLVPKDWVVCAFYVIPPTISFISSILWLNE
jgi:hypothetical protein